jgi:hypothetical protein
VHATCVNRREWAHSFLHRRLWAALPGWELRI